MEGSSNKSIKVDDEACTTAKKAVKAISDDDKFQMILEMAWYLLHPDKVPSDIGCDWAKLVKELERLRVGDIVTEIRKAEQPASEPSKNALNYFKKSNVRTVLKKDTIANALDQAEKFATQIQDETAIESIKKRLELLLNILEMKKYLAKGSEIDENGLQRSMISNPMKGGALAITKPLGRAMLPLFDYFKVVYDPIYSFLERSIIKYQTNQNKIIIPQLTTLLHICNNLKPNTYGVYRITNVDIELLSFIKFMINATKDHVYTIKSNVNKNTFNKQIFKLPKVRLSSLPNKSFAPATSNSIYKDPDTLSSIEFFIMNANIQYLSKSSLNQYTNDAIKDFYKENNIYITYGKPEKIPINVYNIDYSTVDISNIINIDNLTDNYFNKNKETLTDLFFENILDITKYVKYNDAELALSIFIAFKELMPK